MIGPNHLKNPFESVKRDINVFVINNTLHNMQAMHAISFVPLLPAEKMIFGFQNRFGKKDPSIS